jgi:signal recognition particle GTPase
MEELANCRKSISNVLPKQPCETLLVLDGTTGLCYQTRGSMCFWFT